jgi:signal transduction histidine kinase/pSer/pThr/pTyr-binding forkhead associated (FHA) protein
VPRLIVIRGADEGKQFELSEPVLSVGRDASNRIRLHDTEVSRRHAEFRQTPDGYRLSDVGSANGCFVNNQAIKDVLLKPGDQVQIGQTLLVFSAGRDGAPPAGDLAEQISLITRNDLELSSAIVKTIGESEGSRLLARPDMAEGPWLQNALVNLGVLYETTQAVSHILDINQLLDKIMELVFSTLAADRGCVMTLGRDDGQPEPRAVRWRDAAQKQEKMVVSRTVVDHVLANREGVLVSDAARDERFSSGQSIVRFGIREVICVPMKGRHETLGVLYLDTRSNPKDLIEAQSPTGKFTDDHLKLAMAIGHLAALAVEESRYHEAMVQAERLAAIGQTVAALSHHIKNILQGLKFGSEMVTKGLAEKDDAFLTSGWKIVEKNQGKIQDLVMDMLSYSKDREPALEECQLNDLVKDVLEIVAGRVKEGNVDLGQKLDPNLPKVMADREGIHRAMLNIVSNALDAVEERKKPQVLVGTVREPDGQWVRLVVVDNGVGIPPEKQGEVFKPFVSTKGAKGTGLGLAVSRKILREHGGDILLKSQPGKTTFVLRLPVRSPVGFDPMGTLVETQSIPMKAPDPD